MLKRIRIFCFLLLILIVSGCVPSTPTEKNLWDVAGVTGDITEVKVMIDYNANPSGQNKAKLIADRDEITEFVLSLQNAYMGKRIDDIYGNSTVIRFINEDKKYYDFVFSTNSEHILYYNNNCYDVSFKKNDPWDLYRNSKSSEIIVDVNYNEVK